MTPPRSARKRAALRWAPAFVPLLALAVVLRLAGVWPSVPAGSQQQRAVASGASALSSMGKILTSLSGSRSRTSSARGEISALLNPNVASPYSDSALTPVDVGTVLAVQNRISRTLRLQQQRYVEAYTPDVEADITNLEQTEAKDQTAMRWIGHSGPVLDAALANASTTPNVIGSIEGQVRQLFPSTIQLLDQTKQYLAQEASPLAIVAPPVNSLLFTIRLYQAMEPAITAIGTSINRLRQAIETSTSLFSQNLNRVAAKGWASSYCPSGTPSLVCWIVQGDNGLAVSNTLTFLSLIFNSIVAVLTLLELPTAGGDTPLTAIALGVDVGSGLVQFWVDAVRLSGYDNSLVEKRFFLILDAAMVAFALVCATQVDLAKSAVRNAKAELDAANQVVEATNAEFDAGTKNIYQLVKTWREELLAQITYDEKLGTEVAAQGNKEISDLVGLLTGALQVAKILSANLYHGLQVLIGALRSLLHGSSPESTTQPGAIPPAYRVTACQNDSLNPRSVGEVPSSTTTPPDGIAVPSGASLYGIGFGLSTNDVTYLIGPSGLRCRGGIGGDGGIEMSLYDPNTTYSVGSPYPVQYTIKPGDQQTELDCQFFDVPDVSTPGAPCGRIPPTVDVRTVSTGSTSYLAAVVSGGNGGQWPPTLTLVIGTSDGEFAQEASCSLPSQPAICQASLDLFVLESIAYTQKPELPTIAPRSGVKALEAAIAASLKNRPPTPPTTSTPPSTAIPTPGYATPQAPVAGFLQGAFEGNYYNACNYVLPAQVSLCNTGAAFLSSGPLGGKWSFGSTAVDGNEAIVVLVGQLCGNLNGPTYQCLTNADPTFGLPANGESFATAYSAVLNSNNNNNWDVPVEEVNGSWYINAPG